MYINTLHPDAAEVEYWLINVLAGIGIDKSKIEKEAQFCREDSPVEFYICRGEEWEVSITEDVNQGESTWWAGGAVPIPSNHYEEPDTVDLVELHTQPVSGSVLCKLVAEYIQEAMLRASLEHTGMDWDYRNN